MHHSQSNPFNLPLQALNILGDQPHRTLPMTLPKDVFPPILCVLPLSGVPTLSHPTFPLGDPQMLFALHHSEIIGSVLLCALLMGLLRVWVPAPLMNSCFLWAGITFYGILLPCKDTA